MITLYDPLLTLDPLICMAFNFYLFVHGKQLPTGKFSQAHKFYHLVKTEISDFFMQICKPKKKMYIYIYT